MLVSALLAPVFLIGGWTLAAHRQPAGYDATRDTISALAGLGATDRWVMTAGLVGLGVCHLVTALGLGRARPGPRRPAVTGRILLATGGVATLAVAAFPLPRTGSSVAHGVAALVAFGALTLWPVFARVPKGAFAATAALAVLLAWFGFELFTDGTRVGLSERAVAGAQALWPLCVVVLAIRGREQNAGENVTRPGTSGGKRTVKRPR